MANPQSTDAEIFAGRFSMSELRRELHSATINGHPDCNDYGYWVWYQGTVKQAIELKQARQPKPVTKHGHIDIESLKSRADIVDIVSRYCDLRKAGCLFKARCPFHSEKTPSFTVNPDKQTWHCFGACNAGGDVVTFIMKAENTDFMGAVRILGG